MTELYSKLNTKEDNEKTEKMLFVVESLHQVMCDMMFGFKK